MPAKAIIKLDELERLAGLQCTEVEVAAYFRVSERAVKMALAKPEFRQAWERGKHGGLISLRRAQFQAAVEGKNPTMLIWMGKQLLGQRDLQAVELAGKDGGPISTELTIRDLTRDTKRPDGSTAPTPTD